ncbi:MAG: hypothetical protein GC161_11070 [Planctomycetaceae bacterium]|nr:hypothetical protein [Planctomycetaceae bacterium]
MCAAFLGAAAAVVFALLAQGRLWGDGYPLFELAVFEPRPWWFTWVHAAYLPLARLAVLLDPFGQPFKAMGLVSSVPAGAAVGLGFLLARQFGAPRMSALLAALLAGTVPAAARFATLIELHALHGFAVAACLVAITALAPRLTSRGFVWALVLLFLPIAATHLSAPTLGPGWLAFGWLLARHHHPELVRGPNLFRFAGIVALGTALVFAVVVATVQFTFHSLVEGTTVGTAADLVFFPGGGFSLDFLWSDWVLSLSFAGALLAVLFALAVVPRGPLSREGRAVVRVGLVWWLGPLVFFSAWGMPNEGGYAVASLPVAALVLSRAFELPRARVVLATAALLLVAQCAHSYRDITAWRELHRFAKRPQRIEALAAALPEGGTVLSFDPLHQPAHIELNRVREVDLLYLIRRAQLDGHSEAEIVREVARWLDGAVRHGRAPRLFDVSYRSLPLEGTGFESLVEPLESAISSRFRPVPIDSPLWPLVRLEPR